MAVYTHVSAKDLSVFLADYDIGSLKTFEGVTQGIENTNYRLETSANRYILTLFEKRVAERDLPFFISFMTHLQGKGLACPSPVLDRSGQALKKLCGRPALITTFLQGKDIPSPTVEQCAQTGALTAQLHLYAQDFNQDRDNALNVAGWRGLAEQCRSRADECTMGLRDLIDWELAFLRSAWPDALPKGVIHADLFPDNVFFKSGRLSGVIDFYFSCTDYFAYDLAIVLCAWAGEGGWSAEKARAIVTAYEQIRPLSHEERTAMPTLLRGAAMRFLLTRLYDWLNQVDGADVVVKDPLAYRDLLVLFREAPDTFDGLFAVGAP